MKVLSYINKSRENIKDKSTVLVDFKCCQENNNEIRLNQFEELINKKKEKHNNRDMEVYGNYL